MKIAGFLFSVVFWLIASPGIACDINFLTHDVEGSSFIDENGRLRGAEGKGLRPYLLELVTETLSVAGCSDLSINTIPFARGLMMVQTQDNNALFNIGRTDPREHTVKWVGPLYTGNVYFYRNSKQPDLTSLEEAKKVKSIGVQIGAGDKTLLQSLGFTNLYETRTQGHALKMLSIGRVDLAPVGNLVVEPLMKQFNIAPGSIVRTSLKLSDTIGYIAISKNASDEIVQQLQGALDKVKNSPLNQKLIEKYLIAQ